MRLKNKRALITGASQGFGYAVANAFVCEGASAMICARTESQIVRARESLAKLAVPGAKVVAAAADVSRADQVDNLTRSAIAQLGGLDIVVCNAGVYGPKGPIDKVSWDEWQAAIEINLFGVVHTCRAVLPTMEAQRHGKIIILSGGGATKPLPNLSAYAASKAAVVRFAETLAEEVHEFGIDVNTVAPGALNTRLLDEVLEAGPERVGERFYQQSIKQKESGGTPLDRGAALCVFLGSPDSDGITGRLISAVWDPWENLPSRRSELASSEIYTLRRIVPEDRGARWE